MDPGASAPGADVRPGSLHARRGVGVEGDQLFERVQRASPAQHPVMRQAQKEHGQPWPRVSRKPRATGPRLDRSLQLPTAHCPLRALEPTRAAAWCPRKFSSNASRLELMPNPLRLPAQPACCRRYSQAAHIHPRQQAHTSASKRAQVRDQAWASAWPAGRAAGAQRASLRRRKARGQGRQRGEAVWPLSGSTVTRAGAPRRCTLLVCSWDPGCSWVLLKPYSSSDASVRTAREQDNRHPAAPAELDGSVS